MAKKKDSKPAKKGSKQHVKKHPPAASTSDVTALSNVPDPVGAEKAFVDYLPVILGLPVASIVRSTLDPVLVFQNVLSGTRSLLAHESKLGSLGKEFNITPERIRALQDLAHAYLFATTQPTPEAPTSRSMELYIEAHAYRRAHVSGIETAVFGLRLHKVKTHDEEAKLKRAELMLTELEQTVRPGNGMVDCALDCDRLASMYRKFHDLLAPITSFSGPHRIKEMTDVGKALLESVEAQKSQPKTSGPTIKDRFFTYLSQEYEAVRLAAPLLLGKAKVDDEVPSLGRRGPRPHGKSDDATEDTSDDSEAAGDD